MNTQLPTLPNEMLAVRDEKDPLERLYLVGIPGLKELYLAQSKKGQALLHRCFGLMMGCMDAAEASELLEATEFMLAEMRERDRTALRPRLDKLYDEIRALEKEALDKIPAPRE